MRLRRAKKSSDNEGEDPEWWRTKNKPKKYTKLAQKPGWSPILKFKQIFFLTLFIGISFTAIGIIQLRLENGIQRHIVTYSDFCDNYNANCTVKFELTEDFTGNVYFYYGLTKFYQNMRRMNDMFSENQLSGDIENIENCDMYSHEKLSTAENPIKTQELCEAMDGRWSIDDDAYFTFWFSALKDSGVFELKKKIFHGMFPKACYKKPYAPCGALANAFFNDTFQIYDSNGDKVPMTYDGLLYPEELESQYKDPYDRGNRSLCEVFDQHSMKPPNWKKRICELDPDNPENNGFRNFDFIVWMRRTTHPHFKKNYRRLDKSNNLKYRNGMPAGNYALAIDNNYDVRAFGSKKYFQIMKVPWTGGNWLFLGISYIVVGVFCLLAAAFLAAVHYFYGHTLRMIARIPPNMN